MQTDGQPFTEMRGRVLKRKFINIYRAIGHKTESCFEEVFTIMKREMRPRSFRVTPQHAAERGRTDGQTKPLIEMQSAIRTNALLCSGASRYSRHSELTRVTRRRDEALIEMRGRLCEEKQGRELTNRRVQSCPELPRVTQSCDDPNKTRPRVDQ